MRRAHRNCNKNEAHFHLTNIPCVYIKARIYRCFFIVGEKVKIYWLFFRLLIRLPLESLPQFLMNN